MNKEKENPLVSIIIPCYNYGRYIEKCIYSAINQTYENIEVIVVDNGSTDNSLEKINTFSHNEKVKIIKLESNIPPGTEKKSAFNIAIKESSGDYISLLYADDWYLPDKIQKQITLFNKVSSSVGVVYCHGYRYFEKDKTKFEWKQQSVKGYVFIDYLKYGDVVIPISPLVKRYCYEIIGLNNVWTGSEYDFLLMSQYVDFDFVNEHLVVMRIHEKNDAKNFHSVYCRVKNYHSIALLNNSTILRGGKLVNKRIAIDFFAYGLTFLSILDMRCGREALIRAIKFHPMYVFNPRVVLSLLLSFFPVIISRYLLNVFKKTKT